MHLQQRETVEFRVRSTSVNKTPPGGLYLHSEANWKQRNTFSALLSEDVLTALKKERGEDFLTQIKDRLIRVTGKIEQVGEGTGKGQRLQILIDDPLQLALQGE
jgi:hypothetical protein